MMFGNVPPIGNLLPWLLSIFIALVVIGILAWLYFLAKSCSLVRQEASIPLREDDGTQNCQQDASPEELTSSQSFRIKSPTYASYDFHANPPPSYDDVISQLGRGGVCPQGAQLIGANVCQTTTREGADSAHSYSMECGTKDRQ